MKTYRHLIIVAALVPLLLQAGTKGQVSLEHRVRQELIRLPNYGVFDYLAFQVEGDCVRLLGQVLKPTLKADAESAVKAMEGVVTVVNEIEVLPLSPNDDRLRRATYRAIYGSVLLRRYAYFAVPPIRIIIKDGNVTLEGVVATEADKNFARVRASSVPGVFSVTSNLKADVEM